MLKTRPAYWPSARGPWCEENAMNRLFHFIFIPLLIIYFISRHARGGDACFVSSTGMTDHPRASAASAASRISAFTCTPAPAPGAA